MFRFLWFFLLIGCFIDQLGYPPLAIVKAIFIEAALQRQQSVILQSSEIVLLSFLTITTFVASEMMNSLKLQAAKAKVKRPKKKR